MFLFIFIWSLLFVGQADANEAKDYQNIQIYVDLSMVIAPDGTVGTSNALNILTSHYAQKHSILSHIMHRHAGHQNWEGEINVYDYTNVKHMPTYKQCNYSEAVKCGIQNNHWTIRTTVSINDKYAVFTQKLYDQKGKIIGSAVQTAWGKIRWKPNWKLTKISEKGAFGATEKTIYEMWPPTMQELPPLIKPYHVAQARYSLYEVYRDACTTKPCDR